MVFQTAKFFQCTLAVKWSAEAQVLCCKVRFLYLLHYKDNSCPVLFVNTYYVTIQFTSKFMPANNNSHLSNFNLNCFLE
jgi:hypothetical protein